MHPNIEAHPSDDSALAPTLRVVSPRTPLPCGPGAARPTGGPRYRSVYCHALGGLGEVHVAEDAELNRTVALKRIQVRHQLDPDSRRRFLQEAEITARLEHPGVVPIYGLTWDEEGQPCYAMRFIEGESLHEAIRRFHESPSADSAAHALAFRQLLSRFVAVCNTIAYAHSKGVIHRDLKPANIMLGPYGETLVVDWGLAKIVGNREKVKPTSGPWDRSSSHGPPPVGFPLSSGSLPEETGAGLVLGTPGFMSPEQADDRRDEVGPAADVYSLGAILYALLSGRAPLHDCGDRTAVERTVAGDVPPPRRLNPAVPPALEAVCLKAMALRPEDRYVSATALAADVERWLADEPVTACREPLAMRARRWLRRHRTFCTGAAAAILVGVVCLAIAAILLGVAHDGERQARAEAEKARDDATLAHEAERRAAERARQLQSAAEESRRRAEASFGLAQDALRKCMELQNDPRFQRGPLESVKRSLREAEAEFYEKFVRLRGDDPAFQAQRAVALSRLGVLTAYLRSRKEAVGHFAQALEVFRRLAAEHPDEPIYRLELGKHHANHAQALSDLGEHAAAAREFRSALVEFGRAPAGPSADRARAAASLNLGLLLERTGDLDGAQRAYESAASLQEGLPAARGELAVTQNNLGNLHRRADRPRAALEAYGRARAIQDELLRTGGGAREQWQLGRTCLNEGALRWDLGEADAALALLRRSTELLSEASAAHPEAAEYRRELARARATFGSTLVSAGRPDEGLDHLRAARDLCRRLHTDCPGDVTAVAELGTACARLGAALAAAGASREGGGLLEEAVALLGPLAERHPEESDFRDHLAGACHTLARAQAADGKLARAAELCGRALTLWRDLDAAMPQRRRFVAGLGQAHNTLGDIHRAAGRAEEALLAYAEARRLLGPLAARPPRYAHYVLDIAESYYSEGLIGRDRGDMSRALAAFLKAREEISGLLRAGTREARAARLFAAVCVEIGSALGDRPSEAEAAYRLGLEVLRPRAAAGPENAADLVPLGTLHYNFAHLATRAGRDADALAHYGAAADAFEKVTRGRPAEADAAWKFVRAAVNLANLLLRTGRTAEAERHLTRARDAGEGLVRAHPDTAGYRVATAAAYGNLAHLAAARGDPAAALTASDRAVSLLAGMDRVGGEAARLLFGSLASRAQSLGALGRHGEALADWDRALLLSGEAMRPAVRAVRAATLAWLGRHVEAAREAEALATPRAPAETLYRAAAVLSVAAGAARKDPALGLVEGERRAGRYACRAVELLGRAVAAGFDAAERAQADPEFDPIRDRPEFRAIVAARANRGR